MTFRNYTAWTMLVILLIWGPINHSWPGWLAIRIGYLIFIPLIIWWVLKWIWDYWRPDIKLEDTAERIGAGIICLGLWTLAVLEATSTTHMGNTEYIQTHDGIEAVGDDILLPGPDWRVVFMIAATACCFLWFGIIKKKSLTSE